MPKGNRVKGAMKRRAAKKKWERFYRKKGITRSQKIKRRPTTRVLQGKAEFDGKKYQVYMREGDKTRTIYPRLDLHPKFAEAPIGAKFTVRFRKKTYRARKDIRNISGRKVPCISWEVRTEG